MPSEPSTPAVAPGVASTGDPVTILLVDDDEPWVRSMAEVLEHQRSAFAVETATSLETARDALAELDPDCVVSDYGLESGTGLELLEDVRATDDRPFVLITGQGNESIASEAIGREVTDYLPKRALGGDGDRLARRIETAVESHRMRRALARQRRGKEAMLEIVRATSTRGGIAREFCDHLVSDRGYRCAWIGTGDPAEGLVPRAVAGVEGYVDGVVDPGADSAGDDEPALAALSEREPQFVSNVGAVADAGGWPRRATDAGIGCAVGLPIDHRDSTFGVLAVYGSEPTFDPGEPALLEEYARTIGYALRSAEWKESLMSPTPVALAVELDDPTLPLLALTRGLPSSADPEVLTTVARDETVLYVMRVPGCSAASCREAAAGLPDGAELTFTREEPPIRCDLAVNRPCPLTVAADNGGHVVDVAVGNGHLVLRTRAASQTASRTLVTAIREAYPDAGVRSIRSADPSGGTGGAAGPMADMTAKQRTALEVAYFEGFFERPREHNATELAAKLDVSRQTLAQHLRAAQRKLLARLLEDDV